MAPANHPAAGQLGTEPAGRRHREAGREVGADERTVRLTKSHDITGPTVVDAPSAQPDRDVEDRIVDALRAAGCVFAEDEARLLTSEARTAAQLDDMVTRRVAGWPLEHVLGWAEFCGLRVAVGPGVFVPRRRTEFLVREAVARRNQGRRDGDAVRATVVLDLCCGSGAVGAALGVLLGPVELYAVDVDPAAVRYARQNTQSVGGRVYEGDLYAPLPDDLCGRVDLLLANAPYVPTDAIPLLPPEARLHEPRRALDGGVDGLDVLRRVTDEALSWLAPGGHSLVEVSEGQARDVVATAARQGLESRVVGCDGSDSRVVVATRPTSHGSE